MEGILIMNFWKFCVIFFLYLIFKVKVISVSVLDKRCKKDFSSICCLIFFCFLFKVFVLIIFVLEVGYKGNIM